MDYKNFRITLNMKTLLLFEQMADKSFYRLTEDDLIALIYCSLVSNNDIKVTLAQFRLIMDNQRIARELTRKCQEELDFMEQFNRQQAETAQADSTPGETRITDIVNTLILTYQLDINYVMNDLRLWELPALVKGMEEKTKADMVEKRFWTYMQILPHIDGKKIKSPEKLLPFPWEKEQQKQDSIKFMEDNKEAIKAFFNRNRKEDGTVQVQPE